MVKNFGYAARDSSGVFSPYEYEIREPGDDEILVKVKYCGICHSDINAARGKWASPHYPLVTGHEIIGEVVKVGKYKNHDARDDARYPQWKLGDIVGVGCLVGSCATCRDCLEDWENHCGRQVLTYDSIDHTGKVTQGGYGKYVVLNRRFAVRIPAGMAYRDAAPLMCAGITAFSALNQHKIDRGNLRIGVIGLGGLGHLAVQYASKMNPTNEVIVFSRTKAKEALAKHLGAKQLIAIGEANFDGVQLVNSDPELDAALGSFDYLIDTNASGSKPMFVYAMLLKALGTWIMLSSPPLSEPMMCPSYMIIARNKTIAGSTFGGIAETQKMMDFSFKHGIMPMTEHVRADQINQAQERLAKGDVQCSLIIDIEDSYIGIAE